MRQFIFSLVLVLTFIGFARPLKADQTALTHSCASQMIIAKREWRMTAILHEMHELKAAGTTPATVERLHALNEKAIKIITKRLRKLNINYKVTKAKECPLFKFVSSAERERAAVAYRFKLRMLHMYEEARVSPSQVFGRAGLPSLIKETREDLAQLDILINSHQPLLQRSDDFRFNYIQSASWIQILPGGDLPKDMKDFLKTPGHRLLLSAQEKSDRPLGLAYARGMDIIYSIEDVLSGTLGRTIVFPHERDHIHFEHMLKNGEEHPYAMLVGSDSGEIGIPVYEEFLHFEELFTHDHDLESLVPGGPYAEPWRRYSDGKIFVGGTLEARRFSRAQKLMRICDFALQTLQYVRYYVSRRQDLFDINRIGRDRAQLSLPWFKNGRYVGDIGMTLVHLTDTTTATIFEHLGEYLERVQTRARQHRANAERALREMDFTSPGPAWIEVK